MSNQTQIPYSQSSDSILNSVQQYVNKVFRNIYNQLLSIQTSVDELGVIGEVRFSPLTLAQFQTETSTNWILANGQSCVGTTYAQSFNVTTVPSVSVSGVNAFIRVD